MEVYGRITEYIPMEGCHAVSLMEASKSTQKHRLMSTLLFCCCLRQVVAQASCSMKPYAVNAHYCQTVHFLCEAQHS